MRRLLLLALLPAAYAAPEASPALSQLVPAGTLLLVEGDDMDGRGRCGEGTALGALLAEPEVKAFVGRFRESMRQGFGVGARGPLSFVGLTPEDFDGIRIRRAGLAIVDATFAGAPAVDAVLHIETRAGGEKVARILQGLRAGAETFLALKFAEADVRGRKVLSAAVLGHEVCVLAEGDRFLVTTRLARMEEVLKAIDEGHPAPLATAPAAARLRERMRAGRAALFGYADPRALADRALAMASPEDAARIRGYAAALGLDAVEAVGFADVPEGAGYRTEGAVLLKERRGLFALAPTAAPTHRFARMAPADALVYGGKTFDPVAFWDGVLALAAAFDARARFEEAERKVNAAAGIDLRTDLLAALGTEWAGYLAWPPGGGLLPDMAFLATVRDRARLERALDALAVHAGALARERGASVSPGRTEWRGTVIRFLEITDRRGEPRPYAPAWAFGEDFVVFGLCPQTVKHALAEKVALAGRPEFQQLLAAAPRGSMSASYVDLGRVATWLYGTGVPILQSAQAAINRKLGPIGARVNFEDLPPAEVVARHLGGVVLYTAVEPDCIRTGFVSQFGAPLAAVPASFLAGLVVVLIPRARFEADRVKERHPGQTREAEAAAAEAALRAENEMLRQRLAKLEEEVAELRRAIEGKAK
jgi:hypothetical protein